LAAVSRFTAPAAASVCYLFVERARSIDIRRYSNSVLYRRRIIERLSQPCRCVRRPAARAGTRFRRRGCSRRARQSIWVWFIRRYIRGSDNSCISAQIGRCARSAVSFSTPPSPSSYFMTFYCLLHCVCSGITDRIPRLIAVANTLRALVLGGVHSTVASRANVFATNIGRRCLNSYHTTAIHCRMNTFIPY